MGQKIISLMRKSRKSIRVWGWTAAVIALMLGCFSVKAEGAVFRIDPSILLGEEYNDNVFLQRDDKRDAFITHLSPAVRVRYTTSFWDWDLNYTYHYYYYYFDSHNEEHDQTHMLSARNRTEIIKDFFFLEMRDEYSRVSQNIVVDSTQQSPRTNQVDQNVFTVNPYVIFHPSSRTRAVFGYIFQETRYLNASDDSQGQDVNRDDSIGYGEAGIDLSSRLTFTAGVRYTQERNNQESFRQLDIYAGPQYTYAERSFLYARAGKTKFDLEKHPDTKREYWFWDAGLNHQMSTITLALLTRRFVAQDPQRAITIEDQYTATITKTMPRSVLTVGGGWYEYRDAVIDQRISTSDQAQGSFLYRFTPTTTGTLGGSYQEVTDKTDTGGVTWITLATFRLDHQLSLKDTLSFEYRHTNSHSYDIAANNYFNNRYIIEYRHAF